MTQWFEQGLTTLAFCWRVERRDGVTLGFTSHDRDLTFQGLLCRSEPGMVPSAIERSDTLVVDDAALSAALSSGAFQDDDLIAGRWDGAGLWLYAVDWTAPDANPVLMLRGELGDVQIRANAFSVGLRGPTSILDAPVADVTTPTCRANLGDKRCRINLAGLRASVTIASASGPALTLAGPVPSDDYAWGTLRWTRGANAGLEARIVSHVGAVMTLRDLPAFPIETGDLAEVVQGCDKRFATCVSRFGNGANFRGEPHLPGNDVLTRYGT